MSRQPAVAPTAKQDDSQLGGTEYNHDAFGVVTMTTPSGHGSPLFGSDIKHASRIRIEISRASSRRNLSNDWIFGRETVACVEMSHAQFAQFITSNGNGSGTPCTLRYVPARGTRIDEMPEIAAIESMAETFGKEVKDSTKKYLEDINQSIAALGAMIESGKMPKAELREIHRALKIKSENLPHNMKFVVDQANEATDKVVSHAKIEIEAYVDLTARRLGLDAAKGIGLIENKGDQA